MEPTIMSERTFERNGFVYRVQHVWDEDADLSYLDPSDGDDAVRLEAYNQGDWQMNGIMVEISKPTSANWAIPAVVGRSSLWGIESDSGPEYFAEVEAELITEAEHDLAMLREALGVAS